MSIYIRRKPANIDLGQTYLLYEEVLPAIPTAFSLPSGWELFVVNQDRGRCYHEKKHITVPAWTFTKPEERGPNYPLYYLSHEISHIYQRIVETANALAGKKQEAPHGPIFYKYFRQICPPELQHYELTYRPQNARTAGISEPDNLPSIEDFGL